MSKKKTIPCDKCGARIDHIPEKGPQCGEEIYYNMNPQLRLKLKNILNQAKAHRWVMIAHLFYITAFILNVFAFVINLASGMSFGYVFLIPAGFLILQILFIWFDKTSCLQSQKSSDGKAVVNFHHPDILWS